MLLHCAAPRANYQLRSVRPSATEQFARTHDEGVLQCLATILGTDLGQCTEAVRELVTLPLRLGGMGLTSATRIRGSAHWGSWADCLPMINARHPDVATALIQQLNGQPLTPCLREAQEAANSVSRATGWVPPSWNEFAAGARPEVLDPDQFELWDPQRGWQHEAASRIESWWLDEFVLPRMEEFARAVVRSQGGSGAGLALRACPTCRVTQLEPQQLRVLLLRRLQLPLPLSVHSCRCGRPLDQFGHHRAACARAGILGKRGYALESVVARICLEAGGRVTTNVLLRELDFGLVGEADGQRLEVVADGLPLCGGAQLAIDTTVVSALQSDGRARPRAANTPGVALEAELVWPRARSRLVVFGVEVGGPWSRESQDFISQLDRNRRSSDVGPNRLGESVGVPWCPVWWHGQWRILCWASLGALGADGDTPLVHDVVRDLVAAGFAW